MPMLDEICQALAVQVEGQVQRDADQVGDVGGVLRLADVVQQHHELVAADAADGVRLAHAAADARGDFLQQLVADGVAEGVVDLLEPVEVDVEQRQPLPRRGGRGPAPPAGGRGTGRGWAGR